MLDEFLAALDAAIEFVNADVIESRQYGHWRPVERQAGWEENALALLFRDQLCTRSSALSARFPRAARNPASITAGSTMRAQ